jgi:hypothetical protein
VKHRDFGKIAPTNPQPRACWLRCFFVREGVYEQYASAYQAKTALAKAIYLLLYLVPGIVAFICLNLEPVFRAQMVLTGLSARYLQYSWILLITFGWHIFVPFLAPRYVDKLSLHGSVRLPRPEPARSGGSLWYCLSTSLCSRCFRCPNSKPLCSDSIWLGARAVLSVSDAALVPGESADMGRVGRLP